MVSQAKSSDTLSVLHSPTFSFSLSSENWDSWTESITWFNCFGSLFVLTLPMNSAPLQLRTPKHFTRKPLFALRLRLKSIPLDSLTSSFSCSSERLPAQLLSFDTHTKGWCGIPTRGIRGPFSAHSFALFCKSENSSPFFSVDCALFAKNAGVYPRARVSNWPPPPMLFFPFHFQKVSAA